MVSTASATSIFGFWPPRNKADKLSDSEATRFFVIPFMAFLYGDVIRQGAMLALLALITMFISCLGLFAMAAFMAEQRTKEIGIRKSMGANTVDILRMLVWQFTRPVLWANLIAWPIAWWAMKRWLSGFAYHIQMQTWMFVAAGTISFVLALVTVAVQAFLVARQKPILALRYE